MRLPGAYNGKGNHVLSTETTPGDPHLPFAGAIRSGWAVSGLLDNPQRDRDNIPSASCDSPGEQTYDPIHAARTHHRAERPPGPGGAFSRRGRGRTVEAPRAAFAASPAHGLLHLATNELQARLPPALDYVRSFARTYLTRLCQTQAHEATNDLPPTPPPPPRNWRRGFCRPRR